MTRSDNPHSDEQAWTAATWEGSRRAQLKRSLEMTILERLEALDELARTSDALFVKGTVGRKMGF